MHRLALAAPVRVVFQHERLPGRSDIVLKGKPRHIQKQKAAVRLEHIEEFPADPFVVKIPMALAGRNHVEGAGVEIQLFGGKRIILDVQTCGKPPRLLDLPLRKVRAHPFRAVRIQIPRQNARAGTHIQDRLSADAQLAVDNPPIELRRINVTVLRIIRGRPAPVEGPAAVDVLSADFHFRPPSRRFRTASRANNPSILPEQDARAYIHSRKRGEPPFPSFSAAARPCLCARPDVCRSAVPDSQYALPQ